MAASEAMAIPPVGGRASRDAEYFSEKNVTNPKLEGINWLAVSDQQKHRGEVPGATGPPPPPAGVAETMRAMLQTPEGQAIYKLRKAVVEPVSQSGIKEGRGFRRFLLRGLARVEAECKILGATHNPLKLYDESWLVRNRKGGASAPPHAEPESRGFSC